MGNTELNSALSSIKEAKLDNETMVFIILLIAITYISNVNYLLFHTMIELYSVIIACMMFFIAINTYQLTSNNHFVFLGIAYGFVAVFDFLHTITFRGMEILVDTTIVYGTQLWIIARFIESISLLLAILLINRRPKFSKVMGSYFLASTVLLLWVFYWKTFPTCYVTGEGLTSFKVISEYIISSIILISLLLLVRNRRIMDRTTFSLLVIAYVVTILSEIALTSYMETDDFRNMLGHVFKVISFYILYKAILQTVIRNPYEQISKSEERYRKLIDMIPLGVYIHQEEKLIFANPALRRMIGIKKKEEILGQNIFNFVDPEWHQRGKKRIVQLKKGMILDTAEMRFIKANGEGLDVEINATLMPFDGKEAILAIARDLTEKRQAEMLERDMENQQRMLQESKEYDQLKTEFFSNLSHEMRTPLNVIFGITQLLEQQIQSQLDSKMYTGIHKKIRSLKLNSYQLLRLINNVLDITKIDAGFFQLDLENHNIVSIVEDITTSIIPYAENRNITLLFDTEIEEKYMAIDPNGIERIILNLLSNAIKFTNDGGLIEVNIYDRDENIQITIEDNGIGIPPDKLTYIFDRFRQVDKVYKKNHQGSGIGLSLVESLVKMHEGRITVESKMGRGTRFMIELPVRIQPEEEKVDYIGEASDKDRYVERINIEFSDIYSQK